jgi:HlyD family secretion protein
VVESSTSIFIIAENLREMQIEATVGELDVASIYRGQPVRFTMESRPGRRFTGVVENVRMIPIISNNLVSYTVIISVENRDGSLFPGMTCAVDFIVERGEDILLVANAALRYQPTHLSAEQISDMVFTASLANMTDEQRQAAVEARTQAQEQTRQSQSSNSGISGLMMGQQPSGVRMMEGGRRPSGGNQGRQASGQGRNTPAVVIRNLWFFNEDGKLDVMQIRAGVSDGTSTEVHLEDDFEGYQVILRERL